MKLSHGITSSPLSTWLPWFLGGALVASLAWNVTRAAPAPTAEVPTTQASGCQIDYAALGVNAEQGKELAGICADTCGRADELSSRADAKQAELERLLATPGLDPAAARALAREVGELRGRSVEACVEAALRVREVLTPEQTATLLEACRRGCRN